MRVFGRYGLAGGLLGVGLTVTAGAQSTAPAPSTVPTVVETVTVVETTPLPGTSVPVDRLPAPVQTTSSREIEKSGAVDLSALMNARLNAVHVNEVQGNPFQSDVNYRGYTASPLLGTPQGLSVYVDGVRMNQPFGDVVSWDLIPRSAISSVTLMPGSNPLFGLNTLGGALAIQTKDGLTHPGTTIQSLVGRSMRRALEFEQGGARNGRLHWYLTGNLFAEDGWRQASPSDLKQVFGKLGWTGGRTGLNVSVSGVNNALTGNGLQEQRFLDRDYTSIYTKPDVTSNRSALVNLEARHALSGTVSFAGNVYYRRIRTTTLNGDVNEGSLDQAIYQPNSVERAALAAAGYTGVPASGATAENTPFPFWRCIGNVLVADAPGEMCNGLVNRTRSRQHNEGLSMQMTWLDSPAGDRNQLTVGGAFDHSRVAFGQSAELGYLSADRSITGLGVFADGVSAGTVDGEPFDARVDVTGRARTVSVYATNTHSFASHWHLTTSGRYNRTTISNRDLIHPGALEGSLDGDHSFSRFNPAVGVTFTPSARGNAYASYSESSRAATSIELGCADPATPCKLPNAMAGDPPLRQVVTRTVEAGFRGSPSPSVTWNLAWFRAENRNDILFVASDQTGFGYFRNFGQTRRQGLELGLTIRRGRATAGVGYTLLDATYESAEILNGTGNSSNEEAEAGRPGLDGTIEIQPGNRIPLVPRHLFKAFADVQISTALAVDVALVGASGVYARGNENNQHEPDGTYYLSEGRTAPYAVVNLGLRHQITSRWQAFAQVNNLLNRRYHTAAQLGSVGFTGDGAFVARPLPAIGGEFPIQQSTFYAPGQPITMWAGVRVKF